MIPPLPQEIAAAASELAFGKKIIQNNLRALVVEVIVYYALKPDWRHCAEDWNGWDFQHNDGTRLELKQSARQQTWTPPLVPASPRFDIKPRTGYWENGNTWIARRGRFAEIYVFAHHGTDDDTADHRDPLQWRFHVVRASKLPTARTIGLSTVAALAPPVDWTKLLDAVEREHGLL